MSDVFITGTGLVTPLGGSLAETWDALASGQFIRSHSKTLPQSEADGDALPAVSRIAIRAAREAAGAAGWSISNTDRRTGLVVGTSKGPIERWLALPSPPSSTSDKPLSPEIGLHEVADAVARALRLPAGPRLTLSAACASGLHALIRGALMIRCGEADRVLVVAAEASVHPLFVGSFRRLGVLPPEGFGCRPFDQDRAGFVMSEAAAAVCLEAGETSRAIGRVDRFAMGGDATHLTGVDPAGKTLRRLLGRVIDGRPVDLVHGHGTGTTLNDPVELAAIEDLLQPTDETRPVNLYSHKGALGHTLGAAGLVSVVLNCEMARRGRVLPNVQTRNSLPTRRVVLSRDSRPARIRRSLAIAAGFGGPTAVVSIESFDGTNAK
jgi:3-oxoacyl-[acyl-carrier-protein] synthase II